MWTRPTSLLSADVALAPIGQIVGGSAECCVERPSWGGTPPLFDTSLLSADAGRGLCEAERNIALTSHDHLEWGSVGRVHDSAILIWSC